MRREITHVLRDLVDDMECFLFEIDGKGPTIRSERINWARRRLARALAEADMVPPEPPPVPLWPASENS